MSSKESANAYRVLRLVYDEGTVSLRHLFDSNIPPDELQDKLNESATRDKLLDLKNKKYISRQQWTTLYPQIGEPSSDDFDITLLNVLLRYLCGLDECSRFWTVGQPSSRDTSTEADISRIRLWRNKFAHAKVVSLSDDEFENSWQELEPAVLRLGSGIPTLAERIELLKKRAIDPEHYVTYINELFRIIDDLQKQISELRADVNNTDARVEAFGNEVNMLKNELQKIQNKTETQIEKAKKKKKLSNISTIYNTQYNTSLVQGRG